MATCLVCDKDWGPGPTCQACNGEYACYGGQEYLKLSIVICPNGDVITNSSVMASAGCLLKLLQIFMPDKIAADASARFETAASELETKRNEANDAHFKSILATFLEKQALDELNSDVKGVTAEPSNE